MDGYAICTMEAFAESIAKLESIEMRKTVTNTFIASQGTGKVVTDYLKTLSSTKKDDDDTDAGEALLADFAAGFKSN